MLLHKLWNCVVNVFVYALADHVVGICRIRVKVLAERSLESLLHILKERLSRLILSSVEEFPNLAVTLLSIKANGLNLPEGVVKKAQAKLDAEMKKLQEDAAKILDKISVENGNLVLFYNPQAIMFQLMGKAMR